MRTAMPSTAPITTTQLVHYGRQGRFTDATHNSVFCLPIEASLELTECILILKLRESQHLVSEFSQKAINH